MAEQRSSMKMERQCKACLNSISRTDHLICISISIYLEQFTIGCSTYNEFKYHAIMEMMRTWALRFFYAAAVCFLINEQRAEEDYFPLTQFLSPSIHCQQLAIYSSKLRKAAQHRVRIQNFYNVPTFNIQQFRGWNGEQGRRKQKNCLNFPQSIFESLLIKQATRRMKMSVVFYSLD